MQHWVGVEELGEVENQSCTCIPDQLQVLDGAHWQTYQEQFAIVSVEMAKN